MLPVPGRPLLPLASIVAVCLAAACTDREPTAARSRAPGDRPSLAAANGAVRVRAGTSIQAGVNAAGANGTVLIEPGVYAESVVVVARSVHLVGLGGGSGAGVVIVNPGGANNGVRVASTGAGFVLENVTVRGFARNGVLLVGVDGFRLAKVRTEDNGAYGLFPIRSTNGVIEDCTATGHADTGIYVGQSSNVIVRRSAAWANVIGFELENSTRVSVEHSDARDNAVGVLLTLLPGLTVMTASDNVVAHNTVVHNNGPNFGDPEDVIGLLPSGTGILVVGVDRATIEHNTVTDNVSMGIGVVSGELLAALAGLPPDVYGGVDANPDYTLVRQNDVLRNGTDPQPPLAGLFPGVDLLWDGSGVGNCWWKNRYATSFPAQLPVCK